MESLKEIFLLELKKAGLSIIILVIAVGWFSIREKRLENKYFECQTDIILSLKEDRAKMMSIIEQNNEILESLKEKLK